MRAASSLRCLFWATLFSGLLYVASGSDEDLLDFDFSDLKEIDWNYDSENASPDEAAKKEVGSASGKKPLHENTVTFEDYDSAEQENQVRPFDWRENVLKHALAKALTNAALRQKFVEVMPILRVLSSQQRLALSALISAQINARKGQELKLEQVRMMFGDDKKLLIPIVYDIANLVGNSARKFLQFDEDLLLAGKFKSSSPLIGRRNDELSLAEQAEDAHGSDVGTIAAGGDESLEEFFDDMPGDVLDPQAINEELQAEASKEPRNTSSSANVTLTKESTAKRSRRSAEATTTFVHKLIRSVPLSVNQQDLTSGAAGRTVKMNMTGFVSEPKAATDSETTDPPPAYQAIEDLAFADLNGTMVNVTDSLAAEAEGSGSEGDQALAATNDEPLPSPEELIGGPRYRTAAKNGHLARSKVVAKRKRVQVRSRPKAAGSIKSRPQETRAAPPSKKCERFTSSMCIRADDYPLDKIMGSIRRHKNAMNALLAEYYDKPTSPIDTLDDFDDFAYNKKRREDEPGTPPSSPGSGGGMCQSIVRYARPQKARSASGEWKYIVNTGQHTQTLRLEKCMNPQESCSYLAQNYRSHCSQVYNYHRLLSWDKERGLHVDIFKVPTCCSCQVDGYRQQFPPLSTIKAKDFTPAYTPSDLYSTINEDLDYNDDDVEGDDLSYQYDNGFGGSHRIGGGSHHQKRHQGDFDAGNELLLGSKNIRPQVYAAARPTVGSYLSPPEHDDYDTNFAASKKRAGAVAAAGSGVGGPATTQRRRPYKSLDASSRLHEARVDLDLAPSETYAENKEVNIFGSAHAKRKHTTHSAVPHSATTAGGGTGSGSNTKPSTKVTHFHAPHQHQHSHHQHHQHQQHLGIGSGNGPHQHHPHAYATKVSSGSGGGVGGGGSGPGFGPLGAGPSANAHQKPSLQETGVAVPPAYYTNPGAAASPAPNQPGFGKAKPRFHANAAPSHPPASAAPTLQQQQHQQQPPQQQSEQQQTGGGPTSIYAVNSIFSSKYNYNNHNATLTSSSSSATSSSSTTTSTASGHHNHGESSGSGGGGSKRINYSYHPIIDFFENHRRSAAASGNSASAPVTGAGNQPPSGELLYPYTMPKSSGYRERRIGYGPQAGGGSGGGGGGGSVERDNSWHPVVMES